MSDLNDPAAPDFDPRLRVLYGPSSRKLKAEGQLDADGYHFRRAASRAELMADLVLWSPHILMLEWEPDGLGQDGCISATERLLNFLQGYLGVSRLPILLCGQNIGGVPEAFRRYGVRDCVEIGATQSIRETLSAMAAARANPTLWNMLWREAA